MKIEDFSIKAGGKFSCFGREVVGESHYQPALRQAVEFSPSGYVTVWLEREPDNEYDANAIRVYLPSGETVGYLPREVAKSYRGAFLACESRGVQAQCRARMAGGEETGALFWKRRKYIGIWLSLVTPDMFYRSPV